MKFFPARAIAALLVLVRTCAAFDTAVRVEALDVPGDSLKGNPLGDPATRHVAIISPEKAPPDRPLPIIYYLPGWGGSSEEFLSAGSNSAFAVLVRKMANDGLPLRIAVVDGRSRWGGSQFLNSAATGNYADYVAGEVVAFVEKRFALAPGRRLIAGHSSGGYGALMLAMRRHDVFGAVIGLSPDSDFENTHKPLVQDPVVSRVTTSDVAKWLPPAKAQPENGLVRLICGLCANYTPTGEPGRFEWLYDDRGQWRPEVWKRWLDCDPLTVVRKSSDAFSATQRIYLDGAEHDEFRANIGARHIYEVLRERVAPVTFYESPDHHGDHLAARLERGIAWIFDRKVADTQRTR